MPRSGLLGIPLPVNSVIIPTFSQHRVLVRLKINSVALKMSVWRAAY